MGDSFYRSKDPTNSIKVLEDLQKTKQRTKTTKYTNTQTIISRDTKGYHKISTASPLVYTNGVTRGWLPQRAGSLGLNGGGAAAAVPQT